MGADVGSGMGADAGYGHGSWCWLCAWELMLPMGHGRNAGVNAGANGGHGHEANAAMEQAAQVHAHGKPMLHGHHELHAHCSPWPH